MRKIGCVFVFLCLLGCKSDSAHKKVTLLSGPYPVANLTSTDTLAGVLYSMVIYTKEVHGINNFTDYFTDVLLHDKDQMPASASAVILNGTPISGKNGLFQTTATQSFGSIHHWKIIPDNSGGVEVIDDSILSPALITISSPRPHWDTISKAAGFSCEYIAPGMDSIRIGIHYDSSVTANFFDSTLKYPRGKSVYMTVANTGKTTIPGSLLTSLPKSGIIQIWVENYNQKVVTVSGRKYLMGAGSMARTYSFIKP